MSIQVSRNHPNWKYSKDAKRERLQAASRIVNVLQEAVDRTEVIHRCDVERKREFAPEDGTLEVNKILIEAANLHSPRGDVWVYISGRNHNAYRWLDAVQDAGFEIGDICQLVRQQDRNVIQVKINLGVHD